MYGLVVEGVSFFIKTHFGNHVWQEVCRRAHVANPDFSTHETYSERLTPNLLMSLTEITGQPLADLGVLAGKYFVHFTSGYDYDKLLRISGRRFGNFLSGLDNMHEYFRFSYPRLKPPSFWCESEDTHGLVLHYRSRREGYTAYCMGQLCEIGRLFFKLSELDIKVIKKESKRGYSYAVMRLDFDNATYKTDQKVRRQIARMNAYLPVDAESFLSMFPFYIVFSRQLEILLVGDGILSLIPDIIGQKMDEYFTLIRPYIKFSAEGVKHHLDTIFKMITNKMIKRQNADQVAFKLNDEVVDKVKLPGHEENEGKDSVGALESEVAEAPDVDVDDLVEQRQTESAMNAEKTYLTLKGQMTYLKRSDVFVYMATCE